MFFIMSILGYALPMILALIIKFFLDKIISIEKILSHSHIIIIFAILLPFAFVGSCSGLALYSLLNSNITLLLKILFISTISTIYMLYFFEFEEM